MRASLSQETIQSIFELSQQGWSARQIAQELSVSLGVVSKYLNVNTPPARNELNVNTPQIQNEHQNEHPNLNVNTVHFENEHQSERVHFADFSVNTQNEHQSERVHFENEHQNEHQNEHPNPLLSAAIEYATTGWQVIPLHAMVNGKCSCGKKCGSPAKHPITHRGLKDATTDTSLVKSWWQRYPWANVGVVTGEASGIIVLDVDSYKGGMESLSGLWLGQPTENIPQALTGGGGRHLFFRHPSAGRKVGNRCEFMPGLDIRGDGGYIVAPPSNHASGRSYEWNSFSMPSREELADPKALLTILDSVDKEKAAGHSQTSQYSDTPGTVRHPDRYAEAAIERACRAISSASQGQRNATLNEQAFPLYRLAAGGIADMGQVEAALKASAMATGLPVPEIKATLRSARRAAEADPKRLKVEENEQWRANGRAKPAPKSGTNGKSKAASPDPDTGTDSPGADDKEPYLPEVKTNNRQLREIIDDAWSVVVDANEPPRFFCNGGGFSILEHDEEKKLPFIKHLGTVAMHGVLIRLADWMKITPIKDKETDEIVGWDHSHSKPPKEVAPDMVETVHPKIPVLDGIINTPVFDKHGNLVDKPGYDPVSRLFLEMPRGFKLPDFPKHPTPKQVEAAKAIIVDELLHDFPFEDEADRANAVAMLLLPFVRRMIVGCTPLHLICAPSPRSGKSLLADVVSMIATGTTLAGKSIPSQDDEMRKMLISELMLGKQLILLDNAAQNRVLDSPSLAAYLTLLHPSDRLLGTNKILIARNDATWIMTGNNPKMSTELAGRSVRIRIDTKQDRPEKRTGFLHDPLLPWIAKERRFLVSACLTLVHAWQDAGRPLREDIRLGGFEEWIATMGGILQAVGVPGFMENADKLFEEADAEGSLWREFVANWWNEFGEHWKSARELAQLCREKDLMGPVLGDKSDKSQDTRMGKTLGRYVGRTYDGYTIMRTKNSHTKCDQYRLKPVDTKEKAAPGETKELW